MTLSVGIDIHKDTLVVAGRDGTTWTVARTPAAVQTLAGRLQALQPAVIVLLAAAALGRSSVAGVAYAHVEREHVEDYRPVASGEPSARTSAHEAIAREQNDHAHRHFLRSRRAVPAERETTEAGTAPR